MRRINPSMNMFGRFFRVIASNINSFIRRLEDPEKIIEQAVLDMQSDLIRVRQSYAEITATLRRMEGQREQLSVNAEEWYRRAQLALAKGDDDLAREALTKRQLQLENVDNITKSLQLQESAVSKLYSSMTGLEKKISEAKRQKESMIARARTAKTAVNVNDMLSALGDSSSTDAFERMKEKVESLEMQAEIAGELATSTSGTSVNLEKRFQSLEVNDKIEEELKRMRNKNAITTEFMEFQQSPTYIELQPEYMRFGST